MAAKLGELAVRFGLELRGDPDAVVHGVATLQDAGPGELSFLANPRYRRHLSTTGATAVVLSAADAGECPANVLVAPNPYAAYARIASTLYHAAIAAPGIHPSAVIEPGATLGAEVTIGAHAYVGAGVVLGDRVEVGPGSVLDGTITVGDGSRLVARVTLVGLVVIGRRALIHPGAVLGADGFGLAPDRDGWVKVPQVGGVRLGDDVEIGANTTIDRGAIGDTVLEDGVKLDNQIQVGHNVTIGAGTAIAAQTGISGSTTIGRGCLIAGKVGIAGHIEIGDRVIVLGNTSVTGSIREPGTYASMIPADEAARWRRTVARLHRLEDLNRRVRSLERSAAGNGNGKDTDETA